MGFLHNTAVLTEPAVTEGLLTDTVLAQVEDNVFLITEFYALLKHFISLANTSTEIFSGTI